MFLRKRGKNRLIFLLRVLRVLGLGSRRGPVSAFVPVVSFVCYIYSLVLYINGTLRAWNSGYQDYNLRFDSLFSVASHAYLTFFSQPFLSSPVTLRSDELCSFDNPPNNQRNRTTFESKSRRGMNDFPPLFEKSDRIQRAKCR